MGRTHALRNGNHVQHLAGCVCGELDLIDPDAVDAALNVGVYNLLDPLFADVAGVVADINFCGEVFVLNHFKKGSEPPLTGLQAARAQNALVLSGL